MVFELAYVMRDALRRMYEATGEHPDGEYIFYYLTVYNEPYPQPAEPSDFPGGERLIGGRGILRGLYLYSAAASEAPVTAQDERTVPAGLVDTSVRPEWSGVSSPRAQILASGVALRQARRPGNARRGLGVSADVWSATSWTELRRDALACEAWNMLNPGEPSREPYVASVLSGAPGPVVAVSDWIKAVPDQIARWVPGTFTSRASTGSGSPTPARRPGGSSTWTPNPSRWRCYGNWLAAVRWTRTFRLRRSPSTGSTCR